MNAMPDLARAIETEAKVIPFALPATEKLERMMDIQRRVAAEAEQRIADRGRDLRSAVDALEAERARLLDQIITARDNASAADQADRLMIAKARAFIAAE